MSTVRELAAQAAACGPQLAGLSTVQKNQALAAIAQALIANQAAIAAANQADLDRATREGLATPLLKRLAFGPTKLAEVQAGIQSIVGLPDPVGQVQQARELDKGLDLYRVSCPIGLIAMIFESRPDALVQIAALALKSGNALLLKGGSEARDTNRILYDTIHTATVAAGFPKGWIALLETRDDVAALLKLHDLIDLVIPRGSNEFVQSIMRQTLIPVMGHADGICHAYVHASADLAMATRLVVDSKTQYVAVCNAIETLLVDRAIAPQALPRIAEALRAKKVEIRGCPETQAIIAAQSATEVDWGTEYLDYVISVKIVGDLEEAVAHINHWGSKHTELIVAQDQTAAKRFLERVDAASVFWNASTRFADGYRYGLGAEVGISTGKLHARGPVGLEGLVTYKYKLFGHGQIVDEYGEGKKAYTHRTMDHRNEPWS